jgi:uncharacterized protein (DUF736 family)
MQNGAFAKGNPMNIGTIRANDRGALTGSIATLTVAMNFALRGVASNHPNAPRYDLHAEPRRGRRPDRGAVGADLEDHRRMLSARPDR